MVEEVHIAEQKLFPEVGSFPFVYESTFKEVQQVLDWVKSSKPQIEETLVKYGCILFRNFPIKDATSFSAFVEAFQYTYLPYIGGSAPRKHVVGNVYTANEAPPEADIPYHHEMAHTFNWPKKLFFFGDVPPTVGGETPVCLSNEIYKRMTEKYPEFVEKLEKVGVKYRRVMSAENDETSPQGRGWKSTYGVESKEDAERRLVERGSDFEWLPDGDLKITSKIAIAPIQVDQRTGKKIWFNGIVAVYTGWNDSKNVGEKSIFFADGTPLDREAVWYCREIMDKEIGVDHKWEQGDILMLDNRVVLHARRPFVGERRILAYLTQD